MAAAVDLVGVQVNLVVLPELADSAIYATGGNDEQLLSVFEAMESLANAQTNVAAWGLYTAAGLLLLPAVFATSDYPRLLA